MTDLIVDYALRRLARKNPAKLLRIIAGVMDALLRLSDGDHPPVKIGPKTRSLLATAKMALDGADGD